MKIINNATLKSIKADALTIEKILDSCPTMSAAKKAIILYTLGNITHTCDATLETPSVLRGTIYKSKK